MTTQDIKFSWDRISSTSVGNGRELVNKLNPSAPILDMQFPDSSTVVVKLKEPVSAILGNQRSVERIPTIRHVECLLKLHTPVCPATQPARKKKKRLAVASEPRVPPKG